MLAYIAIIAEYFDIELEHLADAVIAKNKDRLKVLGVKNES